jgi:predicted ATP-grasp superfamily ATP-dependent carboligase
MIRNILLGVIGVMALLLFFLYNQNETNKAYLLEEKVKNSSLTEALEETKNSLTNQIEQITALQSKNQQYEAEMSEYLDIFRRHNMAQLASAKPGMIEKSANERTKEVFDEIEDISKRIADPNTPQ